jgi:regulator of replication initiation timing
MAWSEERKAKARATRAATRAAKEQELEGLRTQVAELTETVRQLETMNNDMQMQLQTQAFQESTPPKPAAQVVDPSGLADLCAERTLQLLARRLSATSEGIHEVEKESKLTEDQAKQVVKSVAQRGDLEKMTLPQLNREAVKIGLEADFHRDRLIQQIVEARSK